MAPVGLFDRIAVEPACEASFSCDVAELAHDNIVERALAAAGCGPTRVNLHKAIPHGSGLGGGSSDAAAILLAAMSGALPSSGALDWVQAARALGSDVPFFLVGTAALVEGTGERVTALGAMPPWWCVLAVPACAVSTAAAYRLLDEHRTDHPSAQRPRARSASLRALEAVQRADLSALHESLLNDFEVPILRRFPAVALARDALSAAGNVPAMLSGSGSAVFAIFEAETRAREAAAGVPGEIARTFVAAFAASDAWREETR
jgi:4-diphosphocytidyl-2-C-methyl-D-erythritol kinase